VWAEALVDPRFGGRTQLRFIQAAIAEVALDAAADPSAAGTHTPPAAVREVASSLASLQALSLAPTSAPTVKNSVSIAEFTAASGPRSRSSTGRTRAARAIPQLRGLDWELSHSTKTWLRITAHPTDMRAKYVSRNPASAWRTVYSSKALLWGGGSGACGSSMPFD